MGNFFQNLNDKLQSFMIGRDGPDTLSKWSLGAALVLLVIEMFIPIGILSILSYAFLFYSIFRMLSKNVAARQQENERFESFLAKFKCGGNAGYSAPDDAGSSAGAGDAGYTSGNPYDWNNINFEDLFGGRWGAPSGSIHPEANKEVRKDRRLRDRTVFTQA